MNCAEYERLQLRVEILLEELTELTAKQLEMFRAENYPACRRLDREVEAAIGEKERTIGALRQHMREHRCRSAEPI